MLSPSEFAQLAVELAIVISFLWYLHKRDGHHRLSAVEGHNVATLLAESIAKLSEQLAVQNEILRESQRATRAG